MQSARGGEGGVRCDCWPTVLRQQSVELARAQTAGYYPNGFSVALSVCTLLCTYILAYRRHTFTSLFAYCRAQRMSIFGLSRKAFGSTLCDSSIRVFKRHGP